MGILPKFSPAAHSDDSIDKRLINEEAKIGGQLFGVIPKGHTRQFFCLDEHTWVWHESWSDKSGNHSLMTRYEVRPNGIFKVQNGGSYQSLSENEAKNLVAAAKIYASKVISGYDARLQAI